MTHETVSDGALPDLQERAAILLAEGALTDRDIAASLGITRVTISRWKRRPEFQARITLLQERINEDALTFAIAKRENRVEALDDRWRRLKQVITERAADPDMASVPGGTSGLLVRTYKQIGAGEGATLMPEYSVDTATLREMRETEKQAGQELGQWSEKREVTGNDIEVTITFDRQEN